jgi:hypothetical protein
MKSKNQESVFEGEDTIEKWFLSLWKERRGDMTVLFFGFLVGAFFEWNIVEIFIFLIFLWSILGPLSSRVLAVPALFFLSATPLLLVFEREEQAEAFAVYAYYFLVMAVIRASIEIRKKSKKTPEEKNI